MARPKNKSTIKIEQLHMRLNIMEQSLEREQQAVSAQRELLERKDARIRDLEELLRLAADQVGVYIKRERKAKARTKFYRRLLAKAADL